MNEHEDNIDRLLHARAKIDGQLRQFESEVSILFTDLVDNAAFFDRYGDVAGIAMIHRHINLGTKAIEAYQGRVVKTIGDAIMAEFPDPVKAVCAAVELQRETLAHNLTLPQRERLQLRIGINHGRVTRWGTDFFGDAVNVAARTMKHVSGAQILVTRNIRDAIESDPGIRSVPFGNVSMKGKPQQEELFEIIWTDAPKHAPAQGGPTENSARAVRAASSPTAPGNKGLAIGLLLFVACAAAGGYYWWTARTHSPPPSATVQPRAAPQAATAAESAPTPAVGLVTLKDGLPIRLSLAEDIPTIASEGFAVRFDVMANVRADNVVVIKGGAPAIGSVLDAEKKKGLLGKSIKMTFHLESVEAVDGQKLPIRATPKRAPDGSSKQPVDTGEKKPKDVAGVAGTRYWGYLDGPATVTVTK